MADKLESYYATLGLRPGASPREIRQAYIDLTKVWHPDRFMDDPRLRKKVEAQLREINSAYEHLRAPRPAPAPRLALRRQAIAWPKPSRLPVEEIMAVLILVGLLTVVAVTMLAYHQLTSSPASAALLAAGLA